MGAFDWARTHGGRARRGPAQFERRGRSVRRERRFRQRSEDVRAEITGTRRSRARAHWAACRRATGEPPAAAAAGGCARDWARSKEDGGLTRAGPSAASRRRSCSRTAGRRSRPPRIWTSPGTRRRVGPARRSSRARTACRRAARGAGRSSPPRPAADGTAHAHSI